MGGDKIDARPWLTPALVEEIARSRDPFCEIRQHAGIALPEGPHRVAKFVVPFRPSRRKSANLIAPRTDVPRFSNQLDARKHRVLAASIQKTASFVEAVGFTRKNSRKVESKAINPHLGRPIA